MKLISQRQAVALAAALSMIGLAACGAADDGKAASLKGSCADVDLTKAPAKPVEIRLGGGVATEEAQWALVANPESVGAKYAGTFYTVKGKAYVPNDRLDAYQAGRLDAGTISPPQLLRAVAQGLDLRAVVSLKREAEGGFNTTYVTLEDSKIEGPKDLKGKKVGILAPTTSTEYWAQSAAARAGLDPQRDVKYVAIPFPQQEEALRNGTIDVAVLVQPFYTQAMAKGGLKPVFTALTGPEIDQELITTWFDAGFIAKHPEAFCAYRSDLVGALDAYTKNPAKVAQAAIDGGFLPAPSGEIFAKAQDWVTPEGGEIDLGAMDDMVADMKKIGFISKAQAIPAEKLVVKGYSVVQ